MNDKFNRFYNFLFGPPLNPKATNKHILLIAFLAWIGLGADGLSSSCYGPEEAFLALGQYTDLALYLAAATTLTVFVIALSYNQVIELFPSGGGGYKVATTLINPIAGLISGSALVVDYILTITISIASGVDALFSLLPVEFQFYKWGSAFVLILILVFLNLRGAKESIKILLPIFLGFFITHVLLIVYGIVVRNDAVPSLIPDTFHQSFQLSREMGWMFVTALVLRAYSLGGGTYTGIEAVSNNINMLTEPRVHTGKLTMYYMAFSLAFVAGGIILLYLLWDVVPQPGQTLNAVTFSAIMKDWHFAGIELQPIFLPVILFFEASLLFVAANTGFLGGPAVLANMAGDNWVPKQFRHLSSRLVTQNGILFMGISAIFILMITHGQVKMLVVLYSINVFITFTLSLLGLCIHWWEVRGFERKWRSRLTLSSFGLLVCASILSIILIEKFEEGGWITLFITGILIIFCLFVKNHYRKIELRLSQIVTQYYQPAYLPSYPPPIMDRKQPTAVIFVDITLGLGMHTLKRIQEMFPNVYKNFVFVRVALIESAATTQEMHIQEKHMAEQTTAGAVEAAEAGPPHLALAKDLSKENQIERARIRKREKEILDSVIHTLKYFVNYCHSQGLPSEYYYDSGTDLIETVANLAEKKIKKKFPNSIFFSGELLFEQETWMTQWLYDHTPELIQEALHFRGIQMILIPMKIDV